jgi:3',5'-cyclic AMP phosphodiesterase CpdA
VLGIDTTRSLTIKNGRINEHQIEQVRAAFHAMSARIVKIVVSHHPFDLPDPYGAGELVGRAPLAMKIFASCGVDLLLAGHLHTSHTGNTAERYRIDDYAALVVQAGTAISTRGRGESNSFNVIRIEAPRIDVERFAWQADAGTFVSVALAHFERGPGGWQRFDAKRG